MKILSTTLFISFMTVFATSVNAGSDGSEDRATQTPKPRMANCKDCLDAGYRRGYADAEAAALENTPAGSSSVTTPLSYRKPVYVQAPSTQPRIRNVEPLATTPRKLPNYVQRMQPKVQPSVPNMQPKRQPVQRIKQSAHHAGHGHHTQAQVIDCELTDSLNRAAGPVTTIISTQKTFHQGTPVRQPAAMMPVANVKHGDHYHHTDAQRADCALTDALNRAASPVTTVMHTSRHQNHSPIKQYTQQSVSHHGHGHHSEVEKADCALTDALNRRGSIVSMIRKH